MLSPMALACASAEWTVLSMACLGHAEETPTEVVS
jgi:hypothetical protein